MKASIIISSYNYSNYIVDCIASALAQTYGNLEIIVIDDGSTDGTLELLQQNFGTQERVIIVAKANGGQLSVFNKAMDYVTGEVVFFLDADDLYEKTYVEKCIGFYLDHPDCDFIHANIRYFGGVVAPAVPVATANLGFSMYRAYYLQAWVGAPTTAISMKTAVLKKILPLDLEQDWRIRADDCLVWGASLVGARKYSFGGATILYRIHGSNSHYGKVFSDDYRFKRSINVFRLFEMVMAKNHIRLRPDLIIAEYNSIGNKSFANFYDYTKIIFRQDRNILLTLMLWRRLIKAALLGKAQKAE